MNAEVSADGHNWSTAAYASDYVEKTVQSNYSSRRSPYDYEGMNRGAITDNDVNEPGNGYLWTLAEQRKLTFRNYGEFVTPERGAAPTGGAAVTTYRGVKPFLMTHTNPQFPGFNLDIKDQARADIWLAELQTYVQQGSMPTLEIVRLPNDHTSGGSAGKPTPRAAMADTDLALGRMIAALSVVRPSGSPRSCLYWRTTPKMGQTTSTRIDRPSSSSHRTTVPAPIIDSPIRLMSFGRSRGFSG